MLSKLRNCLLHHLLVVCSVTLLVLPLVSCGGGSTNVGSLPPGGVGGGGTGIVFTGAPAVGSEITAWDSSLSKVATAYTDAEGQYSIKLPKAGTYLLRARLSDGNLWHNIIILAKDGEELRSNISPLSELVVAAALEKDPSALDANDLTRLTADSIQSATKAIAELLTPLLNAQAQDNPEETMQAILKGEFATNNQGFDALVDRLNVQKQNDRYVITTPTAPSLPPISVNTNADNLNDVIDNVINNPIYQAAVDAASAQLKQAPATLVFMSSDSWSTQGRVMALWIPKAQSSNWTLTFETQAFNESSGVNWQGDLSAVYYQSDWQRPDGKTVTIYQIQGPAISSNADTTIISLQLVDGALPNTAIDISNCKFNEQPCALRFIKTSTADKKFLSLLNAYGVAAANAINDSVQAKINKPTSSEASIIPKAIGSSSSATTGDLQLIWDIGTEWEGGYYGSLTIKNVSQKVITGTSWSLPIPITFAADTVFSQGPWNVTASFANNQYTLTPKAWQADLSIGESTTSSYTGGQVSDLCPLRALAQSQSTTFVLGTTLSERLDNLCSVPAS